MKQPKTKRNPLTAVEWDTCWMAIRYAMDRQTIASASLPRELLSAYYDRWSGGQKETISVELHEYLEDKKRALKTNDVYFGDKKIDHPEWMRFMLTLDPKAHCTVTATHGKKTEAVECIEYDGKYYPISGVHRWWDGVGNLTVAGECITNVEKI